MQLNSGAAAAEPMEVRVDVKDSGMMIVTTVTPEFRWQSGTAAIQLRVHGPLSSPAVRSVCLYGRQYCRVRRLLGRPPQLANASSKILMGFLIPFAQTSRVTVFALAHRRGKADPRNADIRLQ